MLNCQPNAAGAAAGAAAALPFSATILTRESAERPLPRLLIAGSAALQRQGGRYPVQEGRPRFRACNTLL